jgi:hypothetical protein
MDEPELKRRKLADACSCVSVSSAAHNHHIQCVKKFIHVAATHDEDLSTCSALHNIKHEQKRTGLCDCTACVSALLAAGAHFQLRHAAAQAARQGCAPCLAAILAYSESMTNETDWSDALQEIIRSISLELLQILLDAAPAHLVQSLAQTSLHLLCAHANSKLSFTPRLYIHSQCPRMWPLVAHVLKRGACVNKVSSHDCTVCKPLSSNECTPLGLLALQGCAAGVETLVATHQADVNLKFGDSQHTALHLACSVTERAVHACARDSCSS